LHLLEVFAVWVTGLGLPLALLMLGVLANHHNLALALDDFAFLADGLYRRPYLHWEYLLPGGVPRLTWSAR
jgi:hypothetical protein